MKKLISMLLSIVMLMTPFAVGISAAVDAKTRLYDAAYEACPDMYHTRYMGIAQNILNQINVTDAQADSVIALLNEGKAFITEDKGPSLEAYSEEEIIKAVDLFKSACNILGITYEVKIKADGKHVGDNVFYLYYNSKHIATLDGDDIINSNTSSSSSGGSSSGTSYSVNFDTVGGTDIIKIRVKANGTIVKPEDPTKEGYIFGGWYSDPECTVEFDFDAKITKNTTLYAQWIPEETETEDKPDDGKDTDSTEWENPYDDVSEDSWYYEAVKFADESGIMNGTGEGSFDPNGKLTRGMFVTMLYRIEGTPEPETFADFDDVEAELWYEDAINWAAENGIVNGVSENEFKPNDFITREQMAAVIMRFAQYKGLAAVASSENLHFNDANQISEYAVYGMNWAVGLNIIRGYGDGNVGPKDNTTRAQAALVLMRMMENKIF